MAYSAPEPGDARLDADLGTTEPPLTTTPLPTGPGPTGPGPTGPGPTGVGPGGQPRNPLLAALGAGDAAVAAVARAFADAYSVAASRQRTVQQRVTDLPTELEQLRDRFSGEELRRALESYRSQVERAYAEFAGRGEEAWERLRETPQVRQAFTTLESYAGKGQRFTDRAADTVVDATAATADAVENAGTATAGAIEDAGDETAAAARKATSRRAPRRTGPTSGSPGPSGG